MAAIPDDAKHLLEGKHFAHVATINSDGTPQASPGGAGEVEHPAVAAEAEARVGAHHDRVELEGIAVRVGDPGGGRLADQLSDPEVHRRRDRVADRAGAIVVLARGGAPEAAAGEGL